MFFSGFQFSFNKEVKFKDFYKLYSFCQKYLPKHYITNSLIGFFVYVYLFLKNFKTKKYLISIFLGILYFFKTYNVVHVFQFSQNFIYKYYTLPNWVLWNPGFKKSPVLRPRDSKGNIKYKFIGEGAGQYWRDRYVELIKKYILLDLIFIKRKNICLNLKKFIKNTVTVDKPFSSPKFSSSSVNKYIDSNNLQSYQFQYLRKNKVYNKGRYSRNRQNYRTGVYMCLYLSVVSIFGLYYSFYKFMFKFTYLWWLFIAFVGSFIVPKAIKYRLYEPTTLFKKFFDIFSWFINIIKSLFNWK